MTATVLRHADPAIGLLMLKALLFAGILLVATFVALRWHARRQGAVNQTTDRAGVRCISALRLASGSRVYLLRTGTTDLLMTESVSGTSITLLPAASEPSHPPSR